MEKGRNRWWIEESVHSCYAAYSAAELREKFNNVIVKNIYREVFDGFDWELLDGIRIKVNERIGDAEFEERIIGIEKATVVMIEAEVDEGTILKMRQGIGIWDRAKQLHLLKMQNRNSPIFM